MSRTDTALTPRHDPQELAFSTYPKQGDLPESKFIRGYKGYIGWTSVPMPPILPPINYYYYLIKIKILNQNFELKISIFSVKRRIVAT